MPKDGKKAAVIVGGLGLTILGVWALTRKAEAVPPVTEFVYVSGLRRLRVGEDIRLEVDIQNIGAVPGECRITAYMRMEAPGEPGNWSSWVAWEDDWYYQGCIRSAILEPGETQTFSARTLWAPYVYQYMVKSEAGTLYQGG